MLKEIFIGRLPSHFKVNDTVRAFIISETFLWSCWNSFTPIFAIFVTTSIAGGTPEVAASSFSSYLVSRVIFELIVGRYLSKENEYKKFWAVILGSILLSIAYFGFAITKSIGFIYVFYVVAGMGLGIATPIKNCLFTAHLDKNKELAEWATLDAAVFIGMALSATLGGFVVAIYGFRLLFYVIAGLNLLGVIPYLLYLHKEKKTLIQRILQQ
jgi:MFS family permease